MADCGDNTRLPNQTRLVAIATVNSAQTNPSTAKTADTQALDALTGGVFSAATSGDRAARVREWLATDPSPERMAEVFKELSHRDKGAAKPLREKLEELRRAKVQETMAVEWADKAQALLAAPNNVTGRFLVNGKDQGISGMYTEPNWSNEVGIRVYRDAEKSAGTKTLISGLFLAGFCVLSTTLIRSKMVKEKLSS